MKKPKADADASSGHKPKAPEAPKLEIDFESSVGAAIVDVITASGARRRKRKLGLPGDGRKLCAPRAEPKPLHLLVWGSATRSARLRTCEAALSSPSPEPQIFLHPRTRQPRRERNATE